MVGGDVCMYVRVDLLWHKRRNCHAWGSGSRYRAGHADLENQNLVYCDSGLESWYFGGGGGCRCVGIYVSLG